MDNNDFEDGEEKEWHGSEGLFVNLSQLIDHVRVRRAKKFDILVTDRRIPCPALRVLEQSCNVFILPDCEDMPRHAELRLSQMMQGIYTDGNLKMDTNFFHKTSPFLKVISVVGHDVSFIELSEAKKRKIKIGTSGCTTVPCGAEVAISLAIILGRHLRNNHILAPSANWGDVPGLSLNESIVGIIGLGRLGMAIARKLFAFRPLCIAYYSRREKKYASIVCAERVLFDDLVSQCDFIFICCPYHHAYKNMFRENVFSKMKPNSVLINMSHGGLVDLDDLFCALRKKKLAAAGMDAGVPVPPPLGHPIYRLPNFLVSGRVGEKSVRARLAMSVFAARNLVAGLNGHKMQNEYDFDPQLVETEEEKCLRNQERALAECRAEVNRLLEEKRRLKEEKKRKEEAKIELYTEDEAEEKDEDEEVVSNEVEEEID